MVTMNLVNENVCDICGEGNVTQVFANDNLEYKNVTKAVQYSFCECDTCGSQFTGQEESLFNNRKITEFHKFVDGLLVGDEIKANRKKFAITQATASELFGGGKVAFSRYENNDVSQSIAMDSLMKLCFQNPYNLALLAKIRKVKLTKHQLDLIQTEFYQYNIEAFTRIHNSLEKELSSKLPLASPRHAPANEPYYIEDVLEMQGYRHAVGS